MLKDTKLQNEVLDIVTSSGTTRLDKVAVRLVRSAMQVDPDHDEPVMEPDVFTDALRAVFAAAGELDQSGVVAAKGDLAHLMNVHGYENMLKAAKEIQLTVSPKRFRKA